MKASRIIYLSAAMLLLAGCSAEQSPEQDGSLLPIVLGSTVADAPLTRAANDLNNTYLAAGQQVTVRISPTGENNYTDYTYTTAASGVMTPPEPKPYYPMTGNVDIRAYHPASAATGSSAATFSVAENQTENDAYIASDLLWAATDNNDAALNNLPKTASTRTLKFQHKLSKITVIATPDGVQVTTITGITLNNVKRKVTFDPSTGATALAATDNDPTTVTMSNNGSAVIPAQPISGTFITINTDAGAALYTLNTTFAAGHQYTFNIAVNGAAIGTTNTITNWNDETPIADNSYIPSITQPKAVDLGLYVGGESSGKKLYWANMNLGANSETDYGDYFMWGDIVGHNGVISEGTTAADGYNFDWTNYRWCNGTPSTLTKYCNNSDFGNGGFTDNKTTLDAADDAAAVMWGDGWRMPTQAELDALTNTRNMNDFGENNTTHWKWEWQSDYNCSGHAGYLILYRENTGNTTITSTLFLPAAGDRLNTSVRRQGSSGCYRSSSLKEDYPNRAWYLYFQSSNAFVSDSYNYTGFSVRAVCEE